jgi:exonuclease SbcD
MAASRTGAGAGASAGEQIDLLALVEPAHVAQPPADHAQDDAPAPALTPAATKPALRADATASLGAKRGLRLLHTSDWHLGRTLFQTPLLDAQAAFLEWLLEVAVREQVDAVLVAGDVYDRAIPPVEAVRLLDDAFLRFAEAGIPLVVASGNHDSAVRLGFMSGLSERSGIHLRTAVDDIASPVVLADEHGPVGVYGIPYLLPDAVMEQLGAERSHESVLAAAVARVLADAEQRGIARTVVLAHAFVSGGSTTDSERDISIGGVGDAPARVFDGVAYAALGHLHRPQAVPLAGSATVLRYSGSPLPFGFGEQHDTKSVALVELGPDGVREVALLPTPVPRRLREVRGRIDDLLARADGDLADLADCWVKAVLTDPSRPLAPMERLRAVWPHTLVLDFEPEGAPVAADVDLARLRRATDPVEVCGMFVAFVDREGPSDDELVVLRDAVEAVQHAEAGA